jgi:hypothetical protein
MLESVKEAIYGEMKASSHRVKPAEDKVSRIAFFYPFPRLKALAFTHGDERRAADRREIISTSVLSKKN